MKPIQPSETKLILQGWQALDPPAGFADRVLAACGDADRKASGEGRPRRGLGTSWKLAAGILAVACVLAPLLFAHARVTAGGAPSAIAHAQATDFDLGIQTD